jgi:4-hydroxy-2-oxoheptanedioate aldolase
VFEKDVDKGTAVARLWAGGWHVHGVWSCFADPVVAESLARSGFDYICIDLQHGLASPGGLVPLLQILRNTPAAVFVRVPADSDDLMMRALDLGADGVIAALVNTAEQAAATVAACRYPPLGGRSWGPLWGDVDGAVPAPDEANASTLVAVMIETAEGLRNVDEIAAVPGLSAIYVGPNDLALSTGHGRTTYDTNPQVHAAIDAVLAACTANGLAMGLHCSSPAMAAYWQGRGVRMLTVATDTTLLRSAAEQAREQFTAAVESRADA